MVLSIKRIICMAEKLDPKEAGGNYGKGFSLLCNLCIG